jgi:hypothetical protein
VIRPAEARDADAVGQVWCTSWRDGHIGHVPDALVALRTDESFRRRA